MHPLFKLCRTLLLGILGIAGIIAGSFWVIQHIATLSYRVVVLFLALIFISNIAAQMASAGIQYSKKLWLND